MEETKMHPEKKTSRLIKIALVISVGLNLAIAGVVAGAVLRNEGPGAERAARNNIAAFGAPYMRALDKQQRREVGRSMRAALGDQIPDRRARRAMFSDVVSILRTEPFDPSRLSLAVKQQAETAVTVQAAAQSAWLELVSNMSADERKQYANDIEAALKRGPKKR